MVSRKHGAKNLCVLFTMPPLTAQVISRMRQPEVEPVGPLKA